jgi:hypothetical protein
MSDLKRFTKSVFIAGILVGILVAIGTTTSFLLSGGEHPISLLNFVASGIFGEVAFNGDRSLTYIGMMFHFMISIIWAFLLMSFDPVQKIYSKNWLINGALYGVFIWFVMALIVMPLSNAPPVPLTFKSAIVDVTVLVLSAGLPISYLASQHFPAAKTS